jgi:hypothetical protein
MRFKMLFCIKLQYQESHIKLTTLGNKTCTLPETPNSAHLYLYFSLFLSLRIFPAFIGIPVAILCSLNFSIIWCLK